MIEAGGLVSCVGRAITTVVNERGPERFLTSYTGDLLWDGAAIAERAARGETLARVVWVMRDMGTHVCFDAEQARVVRSVFGGNSECCQWHRLAPHRWNPEELQMLPCTPEEAIALLAEVEELCAQAE